MKRALPMLGPLCAAAIAAILVASAGAGPARASAGRVDAAVSVVRDAAAVPIAAGRVESRAAPVVKASLLGVAPSAARLAPVWRAVSGEGALAAAAGRAGVVGSRGGSPRAPPIAP